jgi:hypothetical protein
VGLELVRALIVAAPVLIDVAQGQVGQPGVVGGPAAVLATGPATVAEKGVTTA